MYYASFIFNLIVGPKGIQNTYYPWNTFEDVFIYLDFNDSFKGVFIETDLFRFSVLRWISIYRYNKYLISYIDI